MDSFVSMRRMRSGDWPELESLVIATGVRMYRAHQTAAGFSTVVASLTEAASDLPDQPTTADVTSIAERYAAQVAPIEATAIDLETEMALIAQGQSRIVEIVTTEHEAVAVAEEYLGGAVSFGAAAALATERVDMLSGIVEQLRRTFPPVRDATDGLESAARRVAVALEPAIGWADRSAAILSAWD